MEQYFKLHNLSDDAMVGIALLHLESEPCQWYQWMMSEKQGKLLSLREFTNDLVAHYEKPWKGRYFMVQLTNLKQIGSIVEHVRLPIQTQDVTPYRRLQLYINGLNEKNKHYVHLLEPCTIRKYDMT